MMTKSARLKAKRLLDLAVAMTAILVLSPLLIAVAVLARIKLGRPVLFRQVRPGLGGKPGTIVKFRTMRDAFDPSGQPLADDERMTPFGNRLRRLSLDEIPQLWNVVRGDLSLVGPRPLLMEYLPLYSPEQARRHEMRPGITGWAQVNGRNAINWEQKLALDTWYIDHWSLWLDIRILARTAIKVLRRDGISGEGAVTMTKFTGTKALSERI